MHDDILWVKGGPAPNKQFPDHPQFLLTFVIWSGTGPAGARGDFVKEWSVSIQVCVPVDMQVHWSGGGRGGDLVN